MAVTSIVVGHRLVDDFLRFAGGRARPNTVRAYAHDLKTFFSVVAKDPVDVRAKDVFGFITAQQQARAGAENVARISDGGSGSVGGDGASAAGCGVGVLRLSGRPR